MLPKPVEAKKPITPDVQVGCVRFSPCGTTLAAAAFDGTVRRWDFTGAEPVELARLPGHDGWVSSIAFHTDKTRLFSADSWGRLICWDYTSKSPKKLWVIPAAHDGWARKLAISPDGKTLASCGKDGFVRLWAADTGVKTAEFAAKDGLLALTFHPAGPLVTGNLHGVATVWAEGKPTRTFDAKEMYLLDRIQDVGGVRCFAFSADGKTLFAGGSVPKTGGFVQAIPLLVAFDWENGKRLATWKGAADSEGYVHDLRMHPSGYVMGVTSGQPGNGRVFFWKPGEAQPFFTAAKPNCHSLDLHPDGSRLAVAATNANSSGNGRVKGAGSEYMANYSPIYLWKING